MMKLTNEQIYNIFVKALEDIKYDYRHKNTCLGMCAYIRNILIIDYTINISHKQIQDIIPEFTREYCHSIYNEDAKIYSDLWYDSLNDKIRIKILEHFVELYKSKL